MAEFVTDLSKFGDIEQGHTVKIPLPLEWTNDSAFQHRHGASMRWVVEHCTGTVFYMIDHSHISMTFHHPNEAFEYKMRWC